MRYTRRVRLLLPLALATCMLLSCTPRAHAVVAFVEAYVDGQAGVNGLALAQDVAVSPDGKHVYAVSEGDDAIVRFDRDPVTGELTFVDALVDGAGDVSGITQANGVAVSPDGAHVYVVSGADTGAVAVFGRNATSGALTFIEAKTNGQSNVSGLTAGKDVVVSPDGMHVYALGSVPGAVVTFVRNPSTGALTFLEKDEEGVNGLDGIASATELAISPDGKHVYVAAASDDSVAVFARNGSTGRLTFVEAERDGVAGADGIDGASAIAISDDGAHVYAGGANDDGLAIFSRDATNGRLTFVEAYHEGIGGIDGINSPADVAVTPDGTHVVVAASAESEVGVFARDPSTGGLTFVEAVGGSALGTVNSVRFAPGGKHLYTTARSSGAVALFAVTATPATTTASTSTTTTTDGVSTTLPSTTTSTSVTSSTAIGSSTTSVTTLGPTTTLKSTTTSQVPSSTTATTLLAASSSTTTTPAASTSTTTVPEPCALAPGGSPFDPIECRLEALESSTGTLAGLDTIRPKLDRSVGKALDRVTAAHGSCSFGRTKVARQRLRRAILQLARYAARLRSRTARETVVPDVRQTLGTEVDHILSAVRVLRGTLACPSDA